MNIQGPCRLDPKTKNLIKRLRPGDIAIINHLNLDEVAADALIARKVRAVINAASSISGHYPVLGAEKILKAGIPILDNVDVRIMEVVEEGEKGELVGNTFRTGSESFSGQLLTKSIVGERLLKAEQNFKNELKRFALNTVDYALKEMDTIFQPLSIPPLRVPIKGKHVLMVVRGPTYKEDLAAILPYIHEMKPVLIGVDGGADALLEFGFRPHLIIGDMDSISDTALRTGSQIFLHAYRNGQAPGQKRLQELGVEYQLLPAPGTSEDAAMLLSYQEGAELIVAVGAHSHIIDFLGKGRPGMASTFLVRLKVGSILVDAKGVSRLYRQRLKWGHLAQLVGAALLPFALLVLISPTMYQLVRLISMRARLLLGF